MIKAAQEKEELQREGDELDAKIKKAEKELRALENTLQVVNSNNDSYKQSYTKAGGSDTEASVVHKDELDQQLRSLADTYKLKRRQLKQLEDDYRNMEDAYSSMNADERAYEETLTDKYNKIVQTRKDIEQLGEKIERATKQLLKLSSDLRKAKGSDEAAAAAPPPPTHEERDFDLRDLWDFNKNKAKELVDMSQQYPLLKQTLSLLFAQANIPMQGGGGGGGSGSSVPSSTRSSRSTSRTNSVSSAASANNSERGSVSK